MTIRINISYQHDEEKDQVLELLRPALKRAKVRQNNIPKPYKHIYITMYEQAKGQ